MRLGSRQLHLEIIEFLERAYLRLEMKVPPPSEVLIGGKPELRYVEQTVAQAVLIKLARVIGGLIAIDALITVGLFQEQGSIQRTVEDFCEDITFLSFAFREGVYTEDHAYFLKTFWDDGLDELGEITPVQVGNLPRKKIRSYIAHRLTPEDPHTTMRTGRTLYKVTSGYIHGNAITAMDMFVGNPPRYALRGMPNSQRQVGFAKDASNYFYRSVIAAFCVAKVIGDEALAQELAEAIRALGNEQ